MTKSRLRRHHPLNRLLNAYLPLTTENFKQTETHAFFLHFVHFIWGKAQFFGRKNRLDPLDIFQDTCHEMLKGANKADKGRSIDECISYITKCCAGYIKTFCSKEARVGEAYRANLYAQNIFQKLEQAYDNHIKLHGTKPSVDDLIEATKEHLPLTPELQCFYVEEYRSKSLYSETIYVTDEEVNESRYDNQKTLGELLGDVHPSLISLLDRSHIQATFKEGFSELAPIEQTILRQHFGLAGAPPRTLKAISEDFNLSGTRIYQIKVQAMQKLRKKFREVTDWSSDEIVDALTAFDLEQIIPS